MKKIIGGKRYDTSTAQLVGSYQHSNRRDFHYYREELYRKKTGEFFLYGEGGPASRYSQQVELNTWRGGESIMPLTYKAAQEWAEENLNDDEYESIFGAVDESLEAVTVTFSIPAAAAALVKREAEKTGKAQSAIITELIIKTYNKME